MNRIVTLLAAIPVILFSGCVFESYRPVAEFDLPAGRAEPPARAMRILEFRNNSTAGSRLQSRDASGRVIRDPYNKWILPPEQLVARALNLALQQADEKSAVPVPVAGELDVFEVDASEHVFRLSGSWSLPRDEREFRFSFATPIEGDSAEAVAQAAGDAVRLLAEQLSLWSRTELKGGN